MYPIYGFPQGMLLLLFCVIYLLVSLYQFVCLVLTCYEVQESIRLLNPVVSKTLC